MALSLFGAAPVLAKGTTEESSQRGQVEKLEEGSVKPFNEACGTRLKAEVDLASFNWQRDMSYDNRDWYRYGIATYCGSVLDVLREKLCADEEGRRRVQQLVKSYRCTDGHAGQSALTLNSGRLVHAVDFQRSGSLGAFRKEALTLLGYVDPALARRDAERATAAKQEAARERKRAERDAAIKAAGEELAAEVTRIMAGSDPPSVKNDKATAAQKRFDEKVSALLAR